MSKDSVTVTAADTAAAADLALQVYGKRIADGIADGTITRHHFLDTLCAARLAATEELRAENERLREALDQIASVARSPLTMQGLARAALASTGDQ